MIREEQIEIAAQWLELPTDVAQRRCVDRPGEVLEVSSDIRGVGSLLVGPDGSVLFFDTATTPETALHRWGHGARTTRVELEQLRGALPDRAATMKRAELQAMIDGLLRLPRFVGMVFRGQPAGASFKDPGQIVRNSQLLDATRDVDIATRGRADEGLYCILSRTARDASVLDDPPADREFVFFAGQQFVLARTVRVGELDVHLVRELESGASSETPTELIKRFEAQIRTHLARPADIPIDMTRGTSTFSGDIR